MQIRNQAQSPTAHAAVNLLSFLTGQDYSFLLARPVVVEDDLIEAGHCSALAADESDTFNAGGMLHD